MYEGIRQTPTVRRKYAEQLAHEGVLPIAEAQAEAERMHQRLTEAQQSLKAHLSEAGTGQEPQRISGPAPPIAEPDTAVAAPLLATLNAQLLAVPDAFTLHPKFTRPLQRRRAALTEGGLAW